MPDTKDKQIKEQKKAAAVMAAGELRDGMVAGLGTGTTVYYLIQEIARLVKEGLTIHVLPTSEQTRSLASQLNIPLLSTDTAPVADLAIDGVDGVDSHFWSVKGGGGALFREKLIASNARRVIWILDESKLLNHLSEVPLPIEVVPFGFSYVMKEVAALGFRPRLRLNDGMPFLTDNGNYILDLAGDSSMDYREKSALLKSLTGVVETGLFPDFCDKADNRRSGRGQSPGKQVKRLTDNLSAPLYF